MEQTNIIKEFIQVCEEQKLSYSVYRLPYAEQFIFIADVDETLVGQPDIKKLKSGFIFHPFDIEEKAVWLRDTFISNAENFDREKLVAIGQGINHPVAVMEGAGISKDAYISKIEEIKSAIENGEINKLVLSRIQVFSHSGIKVHDILVKLSGQFPEAFVHYTSTAHSGKWIGATPEVLIQKRQEELETMSLAGTIKSEESSDSIMWGEKEEEEQKIVTDYITNVLAENKYNCSVSERFTLKTGALKHLCNRITIHTGEENILKLAFLLHPTPAVCGLPKDKSLKLIRKIEEHDRQFYSGFIGPVNKDKAIFVHLRCAKMASGKMILFAGGGITAGSDSSREWDETRNKMQNFLRNF